mmetsp:Transcript_48143/g.113168  ORF Transcript_48143/g.113168 Transcript_48143/m.113168 type:complete len:337 (-) Transcript_48143:44-1054(-)
MANVPDYNYGLSAEIQKKMKARMSDPAFQGQVTTALAFIKQHTGEDMTIDTLPEKLHDGQILCTLANAVWPGSCRQVSKSQMPFQQMENISKYLAACTKAGLHATDLFQTVDLYESKNIPQVIHNLTIAHKFATGQTVSGPKADSGPGHHVPTHRPTGAAGGPAPAHGGGGLAVGGEWKGGARQGAVETLDRSKGVGGKVSQGVANEEVVYGIDRELTQKSAAKYTPEIRARTKALIEKHAGITLGSDDLHEELKSGVVLCNMMNKVRPGSCPAPKGSKMPFIQMENISKYLDACSAMGLAITDCFQTVDLFEGKNMPAVVQNLEAFDRKLSTGHS